MWSIISVLLSLITACMKSGRMTSFLPRANESQDALCLSLRTTINSTSSFRVDSVSYYERNAEVKIRDLSYAVDERSLPPFCRVQLTVFTNRKTGNSARTEIWLPDEWNERLLGLGTGGWSGGVNYGDMAYLGINSSFAAFSTNTGHDSSMWDASWGLDPEALIDAGYRAVHLSVIAAKTAVRAYYKRDARTNYWAGCSAGARQGLSSAQRYPDDFDGILVGSPAINMTRLQPWSILTGRLVWPPASSNPRWISAQDWSTIHAEVLKQCDSLDGVIDDVLENPLDCRKVLNLDTLLCPAGRRDAKKSCLFAEQIVAAKKVYEDCVHEEEYLYPPLEPGAELSFPNGLHAIEPFQITVDYFKYMVLNDSSWDYRTWNASAVRLSLDINPGAIDPVDNNLNQFFSRGGKILHYFQWNDGVVSPQHSVKYYNSVKSYYAMSSNDSFDDRYRLFPVPGARHCFGGEGANAFGAPNQQSNGFPPLQRGDPLYDIMESLVQWVEIDRPVDEVVAVKWKDEKVDFTRKLCKHPLRAVWNGKEDIRSHNSYHCVYLPLADHTLL